MKPFAISESHLTLSEVSMREPWPKKITRPEKKVADHHWQRTDSIHIKCRRVCTVVLNFEIASFSYVLALERKVVVAIKRFA